MALRFSQRVDSQSMTCHPHSGATGFTHLLAKSGGIDFLASRRPTWSRDSIPVHLWVHFSQPNHSACLGWIALLGCRCRVQAEYGNFHHLPAHSNGLLVYVCWHDCQRELHFLKLVLLRYIAVCLSLVLCESLGGKTNGTTQYIIFKIECAVARNSAILQLLVTNNVQ